MPKKKNKKQNQNPLESLAKTILANTQKAFYFGASNKGSTPHSGIQARFIQEKIDPLIEKDRFFESKLKRIPLRSCSEIKSIRQEYIEEKNILLGLRFLSFFYDYSTLKKQFKTEKKVDWEDNWFDDLKDLKLILATSCLEQYRKENGKIFSKEDLEIYGKLRIDGVTDEGEKRKIYFKRTFFDLKAATLHGTGACELMAEFALFEAIRMSETLACSIHYIRFLSEEYEEINAIALGNWPNEDCLIVCPWLEKGENLIWKKDLQTTRFKHYLEKDIKVIFKISPGDELDQWREILANCNFLPDIQEKQKIRNQIENLSKVYSEAFNTFFPNKIVDKNQTAPSISFRR